MFRGYESNRRRMLGAANKGHPSAICSLLTWQGGTFPLRGKKIFQQQGYHAWYGAFRIGTTVEARG
jgi:hypothetical protein